MFVENWTSSDVKFSETLKIKKLNLKRQLKTSSQGEASNLESNWLKYEDKASWFNLENFENLVMKFTLVKVAFVVAAGAYGIYKCFKYLTPDGVAVKKCVEVSGSVEKEIIVIQDSEPDVNESLQEIVLNMKTVTWNETNDTRYFERDYHDEPNYMTIIPIDWNDLNSESESDSESFNMPDDVTFYCDDQPDKRAFSDMCWDSDSEAEDDGELY